ncbi:uncharacterized protein LODBEIA_P06410 [Lodderomyces beijingensis]|uniref:Uncharacterized protein n=1 Tax=Lodderomyces beijingensis TaxID=1775926 RepID=A0ABP0ZE45_9ASCO
MRFFTTSALALALALASPSSVTAFAIAATPSYGNSSTPATTTTTATQDDAAYTNDTVDVNKSNWYASYSTIITSLQPIEAYTTYVPESSIITITTCNESQCRATGVTVSEAGTVSLEGSFLAATTYTTRAVIASRKIETPPPHTPTLVAREGDDFKSLTLKTVFVSS